MSFNVRFFKIKRVEIFYNIYSGNDEDYNTGYGIYLSAFYNTLIKINSSSTKYYVTTKTFDDSLLNMKLSNVLNISLLYQVNSPWDGYINSVKTIKYENINNGSVSQYIVDNNNIIHYEDKDWLRLRCTSVGRRSPLVVRWNMHSPSIWTLGT